MWVSIAGRCKLTATQDFINRRYKSMAAETKKGRKKSKAKNEDVSFLGRIRIYIGEVRSELNKVSWPDRDNVVNLTKIVLAVTIASSIILGLIAVFFTVLIDFGVDPASKANALIFIAIFAVIIGAAVYYFRQDGQPAKY